ncbi:MAG: phage tail protein, partial [Alphaproteobacteria bacterium]
MATLALGIGGSALFGSFAAGGAATVIGAGITAGQLGFAIGSLAGSIIDQALFAPDTPTPKVPEQRVQGFAYGADIKQVLGTDRVAGTLLWVKGNRIDTLRTGGGGGGPFGKAAAPDGIERLITCRVGIAKGPIDGVIAIWANGKPIYDVRSDPTTGEPGVFRADGVDFTIYRGTGTEEPDPDEEADRGAGNAPAYRHWASIVFRNLPLGNSAQVPQFEFLVAAGTGTSEGGLQKTIYSGSLAAAHYDPHRHVVWIGTSELITGELKKLNLYTHEVEDTVEHVDLNVTDTDPKGADSGAVEYDSFGPIPGKSVRPFVYLLQKGGQPALPSGIDRVYEIDAVAVRNTRILNSTVKSHGRSIVAETADTDYLIVTSDSLVGTSLVRLAVIDLDAGAVVGAFTHAQAIEVAVMRGTDIYALVSDGSDYHVERFTLTPDSSDPSGALRRTFQRVEYQEGTADPPTGLVWLADEDILIASGGKGGGGETDGNLKFYDISGGTPVALEASADIQAADYADHELGALQEGIHEGILWLLRADGVTVDKIDVVNRKIVDQFDLSSLSITAQNAVYESRGNSLIVTESGVLKRVFLGRLSTAAIDLGTAVTTIGAEAGLAAGDFDVSELSGLSLEGMTLNAQAPARQWIETLMRAFFLSAYESGGQIKFRLLDDPVDKSITEDDLGAGEGRGEEAALRLTRLPDTELPQLIEVSYRDTDESREPAVQTAEHPVFTGSRRSTIGIDAVLGRDKAKQLAVAFLYQAHAEREQVSFALPWSYLELEPGDVVSVPHNGRTLTLRLTRTRIGALIECEAVPVVDLFDGTEAGAEPALPEPGVTGLADTEMFLFDMPFLRDGDQADEAQGIYIGAAPSEPSLDWNGARISRASGGDAEGTVAKVFGDAAWGALTDAPPEPDYPGWQDGDLTLRLVAGSLSSTTLSDLLLSQENVALIASGDPSGTGGWEAIQFLTATDNGDGTWTLGGRLLRGIRGTDPYMSHAAGDRIVIVDAADLERVGHNSGASFEYFARTIGKNEGVFGNRASDREVLKSRDRSRKPWAPRNVQGSRDGSNDLTLTWSRRARLGGQLTDGVGAQLVETTESYEVDVLDGPGGSVVRTIDSGITLG